ncbi:MAG TPA: hypothetical protein VN901_07540 [Candidatus Acidoferrales bacterium]|nr:hypothetical protein [Candidatus Acidoferrales bacterium]
MLSLQTESGDRAIDGLADGVALLAQVPVVLSGRHSHPHGKTFEINLNG